MQVAKLLVHGLSVLSLVGSLSNANAQHGGRGEGRFGNGRGGPPPRDFDGGHNGRGDHEHGGRPGNGGFGGGRGDHGGRDDFGRPGFPGREPQNHQVSIHHYVDRRTGYDFYTRGQAPRGNFQYEGVAFALYGFGGNNCRYATEMVVRLYLPHQGTHYLTANRGEADQLIRQGWRLSEELGYIGIEDRPGALKVFRLFSRVTGGHFYTVDRNEVRRRLEHGWEIHSPLGYMYRD